VVVSKEENEEQRATLTHGQEERKKEKEKRERKKARKKKERLIGGLERTWMGRAKRTAPGEGDDMMRGAENVIGRGRGRGQALFVFGPTSLGWSLISTTPRGLREAGTVRGKLNKVNI
jgi:hypothetical protein